MAGLGNVFILPNLTDPTHPAKAVDMYAFGVMTWEVRQTPSYGIVQFRSLEIGPHGAIAVL